MEENKSGELIHEENSAFFTLFPAQTQEMSAEFHSAGKRKQATQGRDLVKIKEGFLEEAALGLDPGERIPFGGFVISENSFFPWKDVPWKFIQGSKGKVMILTSSGVIHAEFPTHK